MPAYSVAVFLPASNCARLPAEGIEAVGKETVDKRKKPETVTTHNKETTTKKEREREKVGETKEMVQSSLRLHSLMRSLGVRLVWSLPGH